MILVNNNINKLRKTGSGDILKCLKKYVIYLRKFFFDIVSALKLYFT